MRAYLLTIAAVLLAGCAGAPADTTAVYDRKYNRTTYLSQPADSEFVGTGASTATAKAKPSWYKFGHP